MENIYNNEIASDFVWSEDEQKKILKKLGNIINSARVSQNITITDLALKTDMSYGSLARVENGESNITFFNLIKICYVLHLYPDDVVPLSYVNQTDRSHYFNKLTNNMTDEELGCVFDMIKAMVDLIGKREDNN